MLAGNVPAGKLAQPELVRVIADLLEAQLTAYRLEVRVIGVCQRGRQVDMPGLS